MKKSVEIGADVNAKDKEECTALHYAAGLYHYECGPIISELLEHGADVNIGNKNGNRPVHTAAVKGNALAVKLLVRKCSDTTCARNNNGETPLHMAARSQTINSGIKIIRLLLKFDSTDINAKDKNGNTPLHCATPYYYPQI